MSITSITFADVPLSRAPPPAAYPPSPKVAIVSSLSLHYECIGFICEMYRHALAIGIFFNGERFGWVPYFAHNAGFDNVFIGSFGPEPLQDRLWYEYDIIIKLTSGDPVIDMNHPVVYERYKDKLYAIMHAEDYKMSERYITISPLVKCEKPYNYVLPVYRGITVAARDPIPMILYVGHIDRFDDDLRNFITQVRANVVFCSPAHHRPTDFAPPPPNMIFLGNVSTPQLIELISRAWFILGKNPRYCLMDRFNGAITLSLSYRKPMIMGRAIQEAYKIPGIVFEENYCEVLPLLNQLFTPQTKGAKMQMPLN